MTHHATFVSPQVFRGQTLHYTDAYLTPYGPAFIGACDCDIVFWGFCSKAEAGGLRDALQQKWHNANWQAAPEAVGALAENARAELALLVRPAGVRRAHSTSRHQRGLTEGGRLGTGRRWAWSLRPVGGDV